VHHIFGHDEKEASSDKELRILNT